MKIFDQQAERYYKRANKTFWGEKKLRRKLISHARGDVLEIACGAGNNLRYYPDTVKSLTAVDGSKKMLEMARLTEQNARPSFPVTYINSHSESLVLEENRYDTIVSTGSLCIYDDPANTLRHVLHFARLGAEVLLLEHGIGRVGVINKLAKRLDRWHVSKNGCHLDRDISSIVHGLCDTGELEILEEKKYLLGILTFIRARKK